MNTQIEKFIKQAEKEVWGNDPYNGSPTYEGKELDREKFAELIVNECIDVALKAYRGHINPDIIVVALHNHFGIK